MRREQILRLYDIWSSWYTTLDRVRAESMDLLDSDDQSRIQHAILAAPLGRVFPRPGVHPTDADALVARLSLDPPCILPGDWAAMKRAVMWAETEARMMRNRTQGIVRRVEWRGPPQGDDIAPAEDTCSQPNWRPSFDGI